MKFIICEPREVYSAVIDMIKSRIERADSLRNNNVVNGIDLGKLKESIIERIKKEK